MSPPSLLRALPRASLAAILLAATAVCLARVSHWQQSAFTGAVVWIGLASVASYFVAHSLIESIKPSLLQNGLWGKDLSKPPSDVKVPEGLGLVPGCILIVSTILFHPWFPNMHLFNAATTAITLTVLTGFMDDVLDLRWKTKIALSFLATLPLLVAYNGPTNVIVPKPLRDYLGLSVELSLLYSVYMMMLAVFFTNSINIYAGVNGLEVGQSVVIALSIVIHNAVQLGLADGDVDATLFSLAVSLPFLAGSLALLYHNWYPSTVFVGDTYTYTAGMTFAVSAILGKSSKTVMLFFLPQFINFALSVPQLFHLVPCPRHRMPAYNVKTDKLRYSTVEWRGRHVMNFTLPNLFLATFGDMNEQTLCAMLLGFQCLCSGIAFAVRYYLAGVMY